MSRLSYQQLEVELQSGVDDDQLKRIQAKYGIAAKRQLQNRVNKLNAAHAIGRSGAELDARRTVFKLSHDQLAQRISEGAKWADIGREAGVRSTYAQAVWASIQNRYPGVKYAHGKGRGRNGHSVTDDDRNTVVLFRQGHITRAQAYERLTACGRTRGGAKQILNKHSHSIPQASEQQQSSHQLQIPRPRTYSNASSTTSSVYDQNNLLYTPSTNYSSSPESSPEPMTPNDKSSVSLPISSLLLPSTSNSSNNTSLPSNDPPRLRSLNTSQHQRPQTTPLLGLGLNVQKPPNAFVSSYDQSSPIRLPPISSERKQI